LPQTGGRRRQRGRPKSPCRSGPSSRPGFRASGRGCRPPPRALPSADQILALPRRAFDELEGRLGRALEVATRRKRLQFSSVRLLPQTLARAVQDRRKSFEAIAARVRAEPIAERLEFRKARLADLSTRADRRIAASLERRRSLIGERARMLASLAYPAVLARGYAIVTDASGTALARAADVAPGSALKLKFADGVVGATAEGGPSARRRPLPDDSPKGQGTLFGED
jgi:exodeoxyribonuclease VII large subunit